ncbi:MAG TPA: NAD(P)H-binding protein [Candidatus Sulfotelmatobacter sp.]|nr:NAD(P)H-binding protein [Candidatus Sulfotelmatobacter sp.]
MKIALIGANGQSGQAFVVAALESGHSIVAGVHTTNPFKSQPGLRVVKIDATNHSDIEKLITGSDAVVSFIGHAPHSPKTLQTDSIKNVIKAMKKHKVKRLVSLTGTGVRFPGDTPSLADKALNAGVKTIEYIRVKDGINHAAAIKRSGLDWTIIRVLKLQNTKPKPYALTEHGPAKLITSRSEVAEATLEVLKDKKYIKKAPIIS